MILQGGTGHCVLQLELYGGCVSGCPFEGKCHTWRKANQCTVLSVAAKGTTWWKALHEQGDNGDVILMENF